MPEASTARRAENASTRGAQSSTGTEGAEQTEQKDDKEWWKSAPALELPWPPKLDAEDESPQSKTSISWDKGPALSYTFPTVEGPKKEFFDNVTSVPTPIPGVVIDLMYASTFETSVGASVSGSLQKLGDDHYQVKGTGTVSGKAGINLMGGVGLGLGAAGIASIGVSGNLEAALEIALTGSLEVTMTYQNGAWSGSIGLPLKFEGAIKVTPSARLYGQLFGYRADLMTLSFGEWTVATAGYEWTPGCNISGKGVTNTTQPGRLIGPSWGSPPEATEA